jgi:hypothetical protein
MTVAAVVAATPYEGDPSGEALAVEPGAVMVVENDLPGAGWRDLLMLIVTSRHAGDHSWAEMLNLGGWVPQPQLSRVLQRGRARIMRG